MIRVLVADDEPLARAGIRAVLESAGDIAVTAEAGDGRAAVAAALAHRPDVALVDLKMPGLDGIGVLGELRRSLPSLRVVMLTSFGTEPNALAALHGGAAGFVLKNCTPAELTSAVRAAHRGDAYLSPAVTRLVLDRVREAAGRGRAATEQLAALAPRESDVLHLLADGLANADIGRRLHLSEATVKAYVSRILVKLGCSNRVQAALLARDAWPAGTERAGRPEGDRP